MRGRRLQKVRPSPFAVSPGGRGEIEASITRGVRLDSYIARAAACWSRWFSENLDHVRDTVPVNRPDVMAHRSLPLDSRRQIDGESAKGKQNRLYLGRLLQPFEAVTVRD